MRYHLCFEASEALLLKRSQDCDTRSCSLLLRYSCTIPSNAQTWYLERLCPWTFFGIVSPAMSLMSSRKRWSELNGMLTSRPRGPNSDGVIFSLSYGTTYSSGLFRRFFYLYLRNAVATHGAGKYDSHRLSLVVSFSFSIWGLQEKDFPRLAFFVVLPAFDKRTISLDPLQIFYGFSTR